MTTFNEMTDKELETLHEKLYEELGEAKAANLKLNMARGKPGKEQLEEVLPMLDVLSSSADLHTKDNIDVTNYGCLAGILEARELMGSLVGASAEQVIVGGNSSLTLMYDCVSRGITSGFAGCTPWSEQKIKKQEEIIFLCPAPGYDRHFSICEHFGIKMIPIPMHEYGPNMDMIEEHVTTNEMVKGIWCVPQYSNPQGYTYSDETAKRFAALKPAAKDFRIFWDNAYCVHHLHESAENQESVLNILQECEAAGNANMVFEFCSTSKITFPGAGISAFISSKANIEEALVSYGCQSISADKINQLRHVRFLKDKAGVLKLMEKHAKHLRPRFELVLDILQKNAAELDGCSWTHPKGGYFISFQAPKRCAKNIVEFCKRAGVTLTAAGATFPYGQDPDNSNIRIAPSFPSLDELKKAMEIFVLCTKLVIVEKIITERHS